MVWQGLVCATHTGLVHRRLTQVGVPGTFHKEPPRGAAQVHGMPRKWLMLDEDDPGPAPLVNDLQPVAHNAVPLSLCEADMYASAWAMTPSGWGQCTSVSQPPEGSKNTQSGPKTRVPSSAENVWLLHPSEPPRRLPLTSIVTKDPSTTGRPSNEWRIHLGPGSADRSGAGALADVTPETVGSTTVSGSP